ncbi:MAG: putative glycosyltransferase EpsJ [Firmicutes bacterium ADurb.Bin419]|nr:MAG: putative glycosyltransferase EpsJ [Firmicutes bacterium ADurb.Bin419]
MKFSIIIPVYNAERHLNTCIGSILSQEYQDFEVILINDGSTDNSSSICDKVSQEKSFFTTIHKENSGAADCRNIGILHAKGDYILFLDSDDTFTSDILLKINNIIGELNESDLYIGKFNYLIDGQIINKSNYEFDSSRLKKENKCDVLAYLFSEIPEQTWSVWRNVYNRNFLLDNNVFFDKTLALGEDLDFFIRSILKSKDISFINEPIVNYRLFEATSVTANLNIKKIKGKIYLCRYWIEYFKNADCSEVSRELIYNRLTFSFAAIFLQYTRMKDDDKRELMKLIKQNEDLLKYSNKKYIKLIYITYRIFGVSITSILVKLWGEIKKRLTR